MYFVAKLQDDGTYTGEQHTGGLPIGEGLRVAAGRPHQHTNIAWGLRTAYKSGALPAECLRARAVWYDEQGVLASIWNVPDDTALTDLVRLLQRLAMFRAVRVAQAEQSGTAAVGRSDPGADALEPAAYNVAIKRWEAEGDAIERARIKWLLVQALTGPGAPGRTVLEQPVWYLARLSGAGPVVGVIVAQVSYDQAVRSLLVETEGELQHVERWQVDSVLMQVRTGAYEQGVYVIGMREGQA